jgi:hypothetical protein
MSRHDLYDLLIYLSAISTLVPLACFFRVGLSSSILRILFLYLLVSLLTDVSSFVLVRGLHVSNVDLIHGFVFVEACLVASLYFELFRLRIAHLVWPVLLLCLIMGLALIFPRDFGGLFALCTSTVILLLGMRYFDTMLSDLNVPRLTEHDMFWINSGVVFYFGATLFISASETFVREANILLTRFVWLIQLFSNTLFHIILAIGIWKTKPE